MDHGRPRSRALYASEWAHGLGLCAVALVGAAACTPAGTATSAGPPATTSPTTAPAASPPTTGASPAPSGPTRTMSDPEAYARARWYAFELTPVQERHGGDWAAFVTAKEAAEAKLDAAWREEARTYDEHLALSSAEDVRAVRVLHEEFTLVASADPDAVVAEARRVLRLLQTGALAELAQDCVHYSPGPRRAEQCLAMLERRRDELAAAVRGVDPASLSVSRLAFSSPEPEAGMTGQVVIAFGAAVAAPPDPERYPPTWQLELWWSGQVMPEANGPRHARPRSVDAPAGRWRFYDVVAPYSRVPMLRQ